MRASQFNRNLIRHAFSRRFDPLVIPDECELSNHNDRGTALSDQVQEHHQLLINTPIEPLKSLDQHLQLFDHSIPEITPQSAKLLRAEIDRTQ